MMAVLVGLIGFYVYRHMTAMRRSNEALRARGELCLDRAQVRQEIGRALQQHAQDHPHHDHDDEQPVPERVSRPAPVRPVRTVPVRADEAGDSDDEEDNAPSISASSPDMHPVGVAALQRQQQAREAVTADTSEDPGK